VAPGTPSGYASDLSTIWGTAPLAGAAQAIGSQAFGSGAGDVLRVRIDPATFPIWCAAHGTTTGRQGRKLFVAAAVTDYDGPFPYVDGLIMQVTQGIGQLEVQHLPRMLGRSNYTMRRLVRLWINLFVNFSVMPLRLSTLTGFALSVLGLFGVALLMLHFPDTALDRQTCVGVRGTA